MTTRSLLRVCGPLELLTLAVLLLNLAALRLAGLAAIVGPVHGFLYVTVVILALLLPLPVPLRLLGLVPGVGGLLALTAAHRHRRGVSPTHQ